MSRNYLKIIFCLTFASFFITTITVPVVKASMINTHSYLQSRNDSIRLEVESLLSCEDVQNQLVELGVSPNEARKRVAALSDAELVRLQQNIKDLPAGSGTLAILGAVFVVLIVLEILGVTNVFTRL